LASGVFSGPFGGVFREVGSFCAAYIVKYHGKMKGGLFPAGKLPVYLERLSQERKIFLFVRRVLFHGVSRGITIAPKRFHAEGLLRRLGGMGDISRGWQGCFHAEFYYYPQLV
jgi:hypothetical protein